jgi:hypothetical protein
MTAQATDSEKDAQRRLRWHTMAQKVLGECSCAMAFKSRELFDPQCMYHQCREELISALNSEYLQGRSDQRFDWMSRVQGRHG